MRRRWRPWFELRQSDWFAALDGERFDLIVGNPPYIAAADPHLGQGDLRHEPPTALASGRRRPGCHPAHRRGDAPVSESWRCGCCWNMAMIRGLLCAN
jgi:hypothetical protein